MSDEIVSIQDRRQRTHRTLIGVILATLPCYACGIILLVSFSGNGSGGPDIRAITQTFEAQITPSETAGTPTETPTITPTYTPGGPTLTVDLPLTPTQFFPATSTPTPTPTNTPDLDATATVQALQTQGANQLTQTAQFTPPTNTPTNTPITPTIATEEPTQVVTEEPTQVVTEEPTEVVTEEPAP